MDQCEIYFTVNDNSMSNDRIYPNDKVAVSRTLCYDYQSIYALIISSKVIFRRIKIIEDGFLLVPSNEEFESEKVSSLNIIGVVSRVYIHH